MINDKLNVFTENQRHCYRYLNQLRDLKKGYLKPVRDLQEAFLLQRTHYRVVPVYKGTCVKTREVKEGVYDIQFWFKLGFTNVTWHDGFQANVMY